MGGSDASGAQGGLYRGRMPAGALWGFVERSDASGCTWGFVEGSDASGALGGLWRGRMPVANHTPVCLHHMAMRLEERLGT